MTRSRQTADWGSRAGLAKIVPSSVAVGSGTGSSDALGNVTFSGASSVSLNGVFNATYNFYKVLVSGVSSGDVSLSLRLRTSGTDNTTANYRHSGTFTNNAVGPSRTSAVGATSMEIGTTGDGGFSDELTFFYPFNTTYNTFIHSNNLAYYGTDQDTRFNNGIFVGTTQFDSTTIYPASGTFTGTLTVLGFN
jgi:hypothetical protein